MGKAVKTWAALGPAWDSSIAREAGSRRGASSAAMLSSMARDARRCQPLVRSIGSSSSGASRGMGARSASHGGGRKPWSASKRAQPCKAAKHRTSLALASSCLSQDADSARSRDATAGRLSAHDAK